ncbi:MAG: hypothetical protein EOO41_00220, partial [Methanobacteriota archaeon]
MDVIEGHAVAAGAGAGTSGGVIAGEGSTFASAVTFTSTDFEAAEAAATRYVAVLPTPAACLPHPAVADRALMWCVD